MTPFRIAILACAVAATSACAAVAVGGAAIAGHDRRSFWTVVDDQNIELSAYDIINKDKELALRHNVEVVVYNGVLLLVGQGLPDDVRSQVETFFRDFQERCAKGAGQVHIEMRSGAHGFGGLCGRNRRGANGRRVGQQQRPRSVAPRPLRRPVVRT